jgi:hypothetical protein
VLYPEAADPVTDSRYISSIGDYWIHTQPI